MVALTRSRNTHTRKRGTTRLLHNTWPRQDSHTQRTERREKTRHTPQRKQWLITKFSLSNQQIGGKLLFDSSIRPLQWWGSNSMAHTQPQSNTRTGGIESRNQICTHEMEAAHSSKRRLFWVKWTSPLRPARRKTPPYTICLLQSDLQGEN